MRTKAEFIRGLNRAGDDTLATKSWAGDRQDKLFIGRAISVQKLDTANLSFLHATRRPACAAVLFSRHTSGDPKPPISHRIPRARYQPGCEHTQQAAASGSIWAAAGASTVRGQLEVSPGATVKEF
jgi:protein-disulfide isomerase-like protein with CxxC motif